VKINVVHKSDICIISQKLYRSIWTKWCRDIFSTVFVKIVCYHYYFNNQKRFVSAGYCPNRHVYMFAGPAERSCAGIVYPKRRANRLWWWLIYYFRFLVFYFLFCLFTVSLSKYAKREIFGKITRFLHYELTGHLIEVGNIWFAKTKKMFQSFVL